MRLESFPRRFFNPQPSLSGGIKMLYPSKYVLVTDVDSRKPAECSETKKLVNSEPKSYRFSEIDKDSIESSVLNFCDGIQKSAAGVLPERIWQDSIMNPAYTNASTKSERDKVDSQGGNNVENSINAANGVESSKDSNTWNFVEPCHKENCSCTRQVARSPPFLSVECWLPVPSEFLVS
jgi:hypothetical protein